MLDDSRNNITLCGNVVLHLAEKVRRLRVIAPQTRTALKIADIMKFHQKYPGFRTTLQKYARQDPDPVESFIENPEHEKPFVLKRLHNAYDHGTLEDPAPGQNETVTAESSEAESPPTETNSTELPPKTKEPATEIPNVHALVEHHLPEDPLQPPPVDQSYPAPLPIHMPRSSRTRRAAPTAAAIKERAYLKGKLFILSSIA